jgi:hypothetical protein
VDVGVEAERIEREIRRELDPDLLGDPTRDARARR